MDITENKKIFFVVVCNDVFIKWLSFTLLSEIDPESSIIMFNRLTNKE